MPLCPVNREGAGWGQHQSLSQVARNWNLSVSPPARSGVGGPLPLFLGFTSKFSLWQLWETGACLDLLLLSWPYLGSSQRFPPWLFPLLPTSSSSHHTLVQVSLALFPVRPWDRRCAYNSETGKVAVRGRRRATVCPCRGTASSCTLSSWWQWRWGIPKKRTEGMDMTLGTGYLVAGSAHLPCEGLLAFRRRPKRVGSPDCCRCL